MPQLQAPIPTQWRTSDIAAARCIAGCFMWMVEKGDYINDDFAIVEKCAFCGQGEES